MSQDIVTRLREWADMGVPHYTKQLCREAARDIEALRKELDIYKALFAEELMANALRRK